MVNNDIYFVLLVMCAFASSIEAATSAERLVKFHPVTREQYELILDSVPDVHLIGGDNGYHSLNDLRSSITQNIATRLQQLVNITELEAINNDENSDVKLESSPLCIVKTIDLETVLRDNDDEDHGSPRDGGDDEFYDFDDEAIVNCVIVVKPKTEETTSDDDREDEKENSEINNQEKDAAGIKEKNDSINEKDKNSERGKTKNEMKQYVFLGERTQQSAIKNKSVTKTKPNHDAGEGITSTTMKKPNTRRRTQYNHSKRRDPPAALAKHQRKSSLRRRPQIQPYPQAPPQTPWLGYHPFYYNGYQPPAFTRAFYPNYNNYPLDYSEYNIYGHSGKPEPNGPQLINTHTKRRRVSIPMVEEQDEVEKDDDSEDDEADKTENDDSGEIE